MRNVKSIVSRKESHRICIELWENVLKAIEDEKYTRIEKGRYDVDEIKDDLGANIYSCGCPLCEYYDLTKTGDCPLSTKEDKNNCQTGCISQYGFRSYMSLREIESFVKILKEKLRCVREKTNTKSRI